MGKKPGKGIIIAISIVMYITADVLMDIYLFPQLTEAFQEHHKEIVGRNIIFFALIPVWITGYIIFEKRQIKPVAIFFGSALIATGIFAFTSLPFIWLAHHRIAFLYGIWAMGTSRYVAFIICRCHFTGRSN